MDTRASSWNASADNSTVRTAASSKGVPVDRIFRFVGVVESREHGLLGDVLWCLTGVDGDGLLAALDIIKFQPLGSYPQSVVVRLHPYGSQ